MTATKPFKAYVFVYGTLKRGYWNHAPYMDGLSLVDQDARTPGQILLRRSLTPILDVGVQGASVAAVGTTDPRHDITVNQSLPQPDATRLQATVTDWVRGELYALSSDCLAREQQLAYLDELEDFLPESPEQSLYERVLAPVMGSKPPTARVWAWVYRVPSHQSLDAYLPAKDPSCWRGEVELPADYFAARQRGETPRPPASDAEASGA